MNASFSNGRYSVCTCVLKTRAATGQHWEVVDFQAGYWEQDCDRCEPPFYRFPTKKHMDCGRCEWGTISPRFNVFLLQNVNAGRCEPPFYREVSHKKNQNCGRCERGATRFFYTNGSAGHCEPPFYREASKKQNCRHCERGTISPRFNAFLLQNGIAGRCEPPFYREASRKKSNRIVDDMKKAPFRQDPTYFFYKMVVRRCEPPFFREASHQINKTVDVVSEAPFRQDSTHFFYKMVVLDVVNHLFIERLPAKKKQQDCGRYEWGTISPRSNVFLLQNDSAGRCEPQFDRDTSHKKK